MNYAYFHNRGADINEKCPLVTDEYISSEIVSSRRWKNDLAVEYVSLCFQTNIVDNKTAFI